MSHVHSNSPVADPFDCHVQQHPFVASIVSGGWVLFRTHTPLWLLFGIPLIAIQFDIAWDKISIGRNGDQLGPWERRLIRYIFLALLGMTLVEALLNTITSSDGTRRRQTEPRDPLRDVELADAVEHQINTLPRSYRRIARLLRTHNQNEVANKLGLSKRKVSQVLAEIREHFASVDWSESGFFWDVVSPNSIASSGEDNVFQTTQESDVEKSA